ncbi:2-keto-4-pentenoate hydratase/2-oxohepta-3-ene-1,7-dioic acid hydratase (catechol pathway) [Alteribacillus persepolensis]|uniref:2-keto-4-pentenoate hydratase/2-oxohepta-3-ene-1,7-dioic acid hydratase (Catechol pathway) n=1 Tax=Alteribacillus persepolensis TaxID=568899 RepID=A0A1G8A8R9_9BACI|nr:fumarylacetoacetate hydrolase family protein [Alteribacillus persepolensis]SDH17273.1 2-keto-4-pentenoate hydratase/2-oxohepta-3-ene-1,7-dioic acid hydratase (catechol pathway) [Alteribacillus persepolensis]
MKLAIFNNQLFGVVKGDTITDVSDIVNWNSESPFESLVYVMENFDAYKKDLELADNKEKTYNLADVTLQAPVPSTGKIWAAPVNYQKHQEEMNKQFNNAPRTIEELKLFLKSPSSLSGPEEPIRLPLKGRRTDHEAELGFVVGKKARNVKASEAKDYIFGYFALLDISIRGNEERTWRKSFDTFTPIGPWMVTADEIEDPNNLDLKLWVNDEIRQDGSTKHLIYDCYKCFEAATQNMTLYPGDIIATGTPEGVGPIQDGDNVRIQVENVGEFTVPVTAGDAIEEE